jgi:hypothetical protein
MTAFVCGNRHPLRGPIDSRRWFLWPRDRSRWLDLNQLSQNTRDMRHFLRTPVSVSPIPPCVLAAGDWVEEGISALSARRSVASSITSTTLHRSSPGWRPGLRGIRPGEGESVGGLAAPRTRECERLGRPRDAPILPHDRPDLGISFIKSQKSSLSYCSLTLPHDQTRSMVACRPLDTHQKDQLHAAHR